MPEPTFLFTDIEGSTTLWEHHPELMRHALGQHDTVVRASIEDNRGQIFKTVGDSFYAVFPEASNALAAAVAAQHQLRQQRWPEIGTLRVRMAIHSGPAQIRNGDYFGPTLNRMARILSAGHGGQILLSDVAAKPLRDQLPEGGRLIDLGEHRLKDLVRPERIFQYSDLVLSEEFPLLRSLSAFAHNLPEQLTSFISREAELAEIKRLLGSTRLLTLSGAGGSGKTRLALQVAAEVVESFPNGVWFVDLASIPDGSMLPGAIASTLRLREQSGQSVMETLVAFLQQKQLLLILDSCEHIVSPGAEVAETLLKSCSHLRILATSREAFGVAGETTWRVPCLPIPSVQDLGSLQRLAENPSVRLFVERAATVAPAFSLTAKNAAAVAQVCRRLDGIPLAIELAAARVKMISPEEIALRLDDRFRLLTGGSRTALRRHQTLRAAIDWSYHLLWGTDGILFRRLSLLCGSFTLETAESICAGDDLPAEDILDFLSRLVDKSLLTFEHTNGSVRYRMLETIREYAFERLEESGEVSAVQSRYLHFFLKLAEEAQTHFKGPAEAEWLERLETEHENLRTPLAWTTQEPGLPALQVKLALSLSRYWLVRGHWEEGLSCLLRVISSPAVQPLAAERARGFNSCGSLACQLGRYNAASQYYEESLKIRRGLEDDRGVAATLNNLGLVSIYQGDYEKARPLFQEALGLFRNIDHQRSVATCLTNLASVHAACGDYSNAEGDAHEALEIVQRTGDKLGVAAALAELGKIATSQRQTARAQDLLEKSLEIFRQLGEKLGVTECLQNLGRLLISEGNYDIGRAYYEDSLAIARVLVAPRYIRAATDALEQLSHHLEKVEVH